jgi:hypothetical protein
MYTLFQAGTNTATNGVAILAPGMLAGNTEQDIRVYRLIIGTPVNSGNIWLYNIANPLNASTANIAMKITLPGTVSTAVPVVMDFGSPSQGGGLPLPEGGNLIIDQTMNVTVIWGIADNSQI